MPSPALQPPAPDGHARDRGATVAAAPAPVLGAVGRRRSFQAIQRHKRPPGGRRSAREDRGHPAEDDARRGLRGGDTAGGVLRDAARDHGRNGGNSWRSVSGPGWRSRSSPVERITISIGVAECPSHGDTPESLIESADAALYEAKEGGAIVWWPPAGSRSVRRKRGDGAPGRRGLGRHVTRAGRLASEIAVRIGTTRRRRLSGRSSAFAETRPHGGGEHWAPVRVQRAEQQRREAGAPPRPPLQ